MNYGSMGQAHRRPDQQSDPPPSAVSPSQAAGTLRARRVIIFGANGGLFVYSGAPAAGNLIASIAAQSGTDPYGNHYNAGINSYDNTFGGVVQLSGALIQLSSGLNLLQKFNPSGDVLYSPTAAAGNQVASIAPAAFTDSYGNAIKAGVTSYAGSAFTNAQSGILQLGSSVDSVPAQLTVSGGIGVNAQLNVTSGAGTEAGATGSTVIIGDSGVGIGLQVIDGADGNTYDTERITVRRATDFTINSTTPQTIMSHAVGPRVYEVEVWLVTQNATAADAAGFAFTAPGGNSGLVDFQCTSGTSPAVVTYGASGSPTATFNGQGVAGNQRVHMLATIAFTVAGTLAITGKELVAGNTINVSTGSRMRICPVAAT